MEQENTLERVQDAAKFMAVSRSKVYQMMESGQLPFVKLGKSRRIPRWAIQQLIQEHTVGDVRRAIV